MKHTTVFFISLIATFLAVDSAMSEPAVSYVSKTTAPLFSSDTTLQIKVRTDFSSLIDRRYGYGTNKLDRKFQAVDLELIGPEADSFPLLTMASVSGRGAMRGNICPFPQLKIDFENRPGPKSFFRGLKELKMVTHCGVNLPGRSIDLNESVRMEYLVYRLSQAALDLSLHVRLAHVTYEDTSGTLDSFQSYAIFVEDVGDLAKRFSVKRVYNPKQVDARPELKDSLLSNVAQVDPLRRARLDLFQIMIGNSDYHWGHNLKGISGPFGFDLIPYDFDYAKIFASRIGDDAYVFEFDAATTSTPMNCISSDMLKALFDEFSRKRKKILNVVEGTEIIDARAQAMALDSLSTFFRRLSSIDIPQNRVVNVDCGK